MKKADYLESLEKKYQQKYGVAVFDIKTKNLKTGTEIRGEVLTENQKNDIINALEKRKIKVKKANVKVLSDAGERNEIGWGVVKKDIANLKSRFVSNKILNKKILARIRCSQVLKGEILRVLYKYENQLLVQQGDLTLGWVDKSEVIEKKKSLYKEWKSGSYAVKNKTLNLKNILKCHPEFISGSAADSKKIDIRQKILKQVQNDNFNNFGSLRKKVLKEAEKYLGAKYVYGGKSEKGIDCSGLVQVAYKNSLGIILPRHSWDQKMVGRKVKLENIKSGDLIFLIKKENRHRHVGIAEKVLMGNAKRLHSSEAETIEPANLNLIHASLDNKKVVRQSLKEVLKSYDFIEARRVAE